MEASSQTPLRSTAVYPPSKVLQGQSVRLEPLSEKHTDDLAKNIADSSSVDDKYWRYVPEGPFHDRLAFDEFIKRKSCTEDAVFFAVVNLATEEAVGILSLMRIDLLNSSIEIGWVFFSPTIQRSTITTECIFLLLKLVFENLTFRRCEWKCDNLNIPSKRAAERFGFTFEGVFRQHVIVKGRNRDTAWFSIIDTEWPHKKTAFERWLSPGNFDEHGLQRKRLEDFRHVS